MSGERETQPRGNCRETSASRSVEVNGQDLRRSCPIDRCFGSHLSSLASRVRRVSPNPLAKSPLSLKTTHYLVLECRAKRERNAVGPVSKAGLFARVKDDGGAEAALIAVAGLKRRAGQ